MSETVVMGAAVGYSEGQIAPFLGSLRRAGYGGDVVLLVSPQVARRAVGEAPFAGVTLVPVGQWWPVRFGWLRRGRVLRAAWDLTQALLWLVLQLSRRSATLRHVVACRLLPPTETRYLHFLRMLRTAPQYRRVLLCDVRDVIFQSDPFAALPEAGLAVSMEPAHVTIAGERYNAAWVRAAGGESLLRQIGACRVSCSGVTYGGREAMLHYLELMERALVSLGREASGRSGVDQGIHNALVWTGRLGPVRQLESLASPVATISGIDDAELRLDRDRRLLNRDGSLVSVVHQYDRSPLLRGALSRGVEIAA